MTNDRYDTRIVIEHAGPDWVIEKKGVTYSQASQAVESAHYIAPTGATVTVTTTKLATPTQ